MRKMTDSEAKWNLNHLYGIVDQEYKKSLDVALSAFDSLEKIRTIVEYGSVTGVDPDVIFAIKTILNDRNK